MPDIREGGDRLAIKPQLKSVKLQASHVPAPRVSLMVANRTTAVNRPLEQIWNTVLRYWGVYTTSQLVSEAKLPGIRNPLLR